MPRQRNTVSTITKEVNVRNSCAPVPVLKTKTAIATLAPGDVLRVISCDRDSAQDLPMFCAHTGHELISHRAWGDAHEFLIRKS